MKKRDVINTSIIIIFILYIIFYKTTLITQMLKYENLITSLFLITLTFISYLLLGYKKTKENLKRKKIFGLILYEIIIYFFVYYGSGILFGFQNNIYSLKIKNIILNIITPTIIIISSEILRNIIIQSNKDKKIVIILITILYAILELMSTINYYHMETPLGLFKLVACGLIPLLSKHSMLSYLTYYTGLKNSLIYRLIFTLYIYFVPILPNLGDYLTCITEMVFPFVIFITTTNIVTKHEYVEAEIKEKKFGLSDAIITVIFLVVLSVVGGVFNYKLISIASNSMNPVIYRGDSVLIEKYDGNKEYKVDDIISFEYCGRTTVHRIVSIEEIDGVKYYHTKGDNNDSEDATLVPVNNVYGKVKFKIPYIGYPSVIISDIRSGRFGK